MIAPLLKDRESICAQVRLDSQVSAVSFRQQKATTAFSLFHGSYEISAADFKIIQGISNIKILLLFRDSKRIREQASRD